MHGCSGGACMVAPGGHAWLLPGGMRGCSWGGMHGCSQGEHAWFLPGGHAWFFLGGHTWFLPGGDMHGFFRGACMVFPGGVCVGYDEIRSMSRRYASYWNAFLLFVVNIILKQECIPVGCVPTAAVAATRCQYQGGLNEADTPPTHVGRPP